MKLLKFKTTLTRIFPKTQYTLRCSWMCMTVKHKHQSTHVCRKIKMKRWLPILRISTKYWMKFQPTFGRTLVKSLTVPYLQPIEIQQTKIWEENTESFTHIPFKYLNLATTTNRVRTQSINSMNSISLCLVKNLHKQWLNTFKLNQPKSIWLKCSMATIFF